MGKHQLDKIAAKLRSGLDPVVITIELAAAAGQDEIDGRTYALIKRLKAAGVLTSLRVRGAYLVVGREHTNRHVAEAWLRLHPGQGRITRAHCLVHRGLIVVEVLQHAKVKGLEAYVLVCHVKEFLPDEPFWLPNVE